MRPSFQTVIVTLLSCALIACEEPQPEDAPPPEPDRRTAQALHHYAAICNEPQAFVVPEPKAGDEKKLVTFSRFSDEKNAAYAQRSLRALSDWEAKRPEDVGLVLCVDRKRKEVARKCEFGGGAVVSYYDTAEHLRVIDPATGKVVAEEHYELEGPTSCPLSYEFRKGKNLYDAADHGRKLLAAVAALQPEGTAIPAVGSKNELGSVCRGLPFPHVAPHDPAAAEHQNAYVQQRYRDVDGIFPSPGGTEAADFPLVVCVTGKETQKQRDCPFSGGAVLEYHDGEVQVEIRETRTARVLAKENFEADGKKSRCPTVNTFFGKRDIDLGKIDPAYDAFVARFTGKAAKATPTPAKARSATAGPPAPKKSAPKGNPIAGLQPL